MNTEKNSLNEHLKNYVDKLEIKQKKKKENRNKAVKKYKSNNCLTLSLYLEKDLIILFREKTKYLNISQTSVVKNAIEIFLENN